MNIFAGKTPNERNKIIAFIVLGTMAMISLTYTFGGLLWSGGGGKTTVNITTASPSPTPTVTNLTNPNPNLPTQAEIYSEYETTPIVYNPNSFYAPPPGRNIFAFYEPGDPIPPPPFIPTEKTPIPETPYPTPTPTPIPPLRVDYVNPQSIYAGMQGFRLQISGDKFTPESQIYFNAVPLPTTYVSPQQIYAQVPASYIANAGRVRILVATPDGKLYSNEGYFNVQAAPRPQFAYIGLIAHRHNNNDTAFFQEEGKREPTEARLNDIVAGRFRVTSISVEEVELRDTQLGFRHRLKLERPAPGSTTYTNPPQPDDPEPIIDSDQQ